jgi:hypothetical protein
MDHLFLLIIDLVLEIGGHEACPSRYMGYRSLEVVLSGTFRVMAVCSGSTVIR